MAEMKTLNGYEVVDAKARAEIETLKALVDKLDKQLNPMVEVWKIRGDANIDQANWASWTINFTANGVAFRGMRLGGDGDPVLNYILADLTNTEVAISGMSYSGEVTTEDYLTIKFIRNESLPEAFVNWIEANADYQGEEPYKAGITWLPKYVSGVWGLEGHGVGYESDPNQEVNFEYNGTKYVKIYSGYNEYGDDMIAFLSEYGETLSIYSIGDTYLPSDATIDFGDTPQAVTPSFYEWLEYYFYNITALG